MSIPKQSPKLKDALALRGQPIGSMLFRPSKISAGRPGPQKKGWAVAAVALLWWRIWARSEPMDWPRAHHFVEAQLLFLALPRQVHGALARPVLSWVWSTTRSTSSCFAAWWVWVLGMSWLGLKSGRAAWLVHLLSCSSRKTLWS